MDPRSSAHPSLETLQAYALGTLDDARAEVVAQHLEGCPECRRRAAEVAPDTFLARLRAAQDRPEIPGPADAIPLDESQLDLEGTSPHPGEATVASASDPRGTAIPTRSLPSGPRPEWEISEEPTLDPMTTNETPMVSDDTQIAGEDGPTGGCLPDGTRIGYFGDYELLRVLGEGGMGTVYKARQLSLNRPVALKMIRASRFPSADEVRRFHNEAEAVARLDHPNIVPIFEVGRYEDQHYFSMKLIGGESLDKRLKDYVADPRRAARLMAATADAIHHAHQRGILHRDLKPANILVDPNGQPHVTDFGLAKRVDGDSELTRSGAIVGTPSYMAPEQTSGKRGVVTTLTDVYGLGAVLYAVLVGRAPFGGATVLNTLEQVRECEPEPPRRSNPKVSRDLEVICLKCLEKDPRQRYASADALAEDLSRWLNGEPVRAQPPTLGYLLGKAVRRHRIAIALTSTLFLAAVLGTIAAVATSAALRTERARKEAVLARERADRATAGEKLARDKEAEARRSIEGLKEELRSRLVQKVDVANGVRLLDQGDSFSSLAWFADALRLEQGDADGEIAARTRLISVLSHYPRLTQVVFHDGFVNDARFSPDGGRIVTASSDNTARVWDAASGRPITPPLKHKSFVSYASFSADGRRVVTVSHVPTRRDETTLVWDASTGLPISSPPDDEGRAAGGSFSADGLRLVTVSLDGVARVWDAKSGEPVSPPLKYAGRGARASFSPDGRRVLSVRRDRGARMWDANLGWRYTPLITVGREGRVVDAVFGPHGLCVLAFSGDHIARVWDTDRHQPISPPLEHQGMVLRGSLSLDARRVVTVSQDGARVWETRSGRPISPPLDHERKVIEASFSPDGQRLVTADESGAARVWDLSPQLAISPPLHHGSTVWHASFSADGRRVLTASSDNTARVWDAFSGQPMTPPLITHDPETAKAFSRDGRYVLITGSDGTARVLDAKSGERVTPPIKHGAWIVAASFSPDGRRMVTASYDGTARIWDVNSGLPIIGPLLPEHLVTAWGPFRCTHASFSPDGQRVLAAGGHIGGGGEARVWDARTGDPVSPPLKHELNVLHAEFSPDGRRIVTAHGRPWINDLKPEEGEACVWDVNTGKPVSPPLRHQARVNHAAFSRDGRWIVTASADRSARVWDARSGQPISPLLKHDGSVNYATFSPDGRRVATASNDGTACIWEAALVRPSSPLLTCPLDDLIALTQLVSSTRVDSSGDVAQLSQDDYQARWHTLQGRYPECFRSSPEELVAWHWREAAACENDQAWASAVGHLDALIAAEPGQWMLHSRRGRANASLGRWNDAVADYSRAIKLRPVQDALWRYERLFNSRGDAYAEMGHWGPAIADFSRAHALDSRDPEARIGLGLISLANSDAREFGDSCARLLRDFRRSHELELTAIIVRTCTRVPLSTQDGELAIRLALRVPEAFELLGAAQFRAGKFEDAVASLTKALQEAPTNAGDSANRNRERIEGVSTPGNPVNDPATLLFLSLAHQRLGHTGESRQWLEKAKSAIDRRSRADKLGAPSNLRFGWRERVSLVALHHEAEAVILYDPVFPADPFVP